jgi:hypothetical protein
MEKALANLWLLAPIFRAAITERWEVSALVSLLPPSHSMEGQAVLLAVAHGQEPAKAGLESELRGDAS